MSADTNSNDSNPSIDAQSETQLCLGNLDIIDSILSKYDTTNNENKTKIQESKIESPALTENIIINKSSTNLLNRKSKSMYFNSNGKTHSTPKAALCKEIEFLNAMFNEGSLNDSNTEITIDVDNKHIRSSVYDTKSCKVSPIITTQTQSILRNNKTIVSQETPCLSQENKKNVHFDKNDQTKVNRNLEFEEEEERLSYKKLEIVQEDDELLANMCNFESAKSFNKCDDLIKESNNIVQVGFQTGNGSKITIKKETLIGALEKNKQDVNNNKTTQEAKKPFNELNNITQANHNNVQIMGFKTASNKNITVKKESALNPFLMDEELNSIAIETTTNSNQNLVQVGFKTASNKDISVKANSFANINFFNDEDIDMISDQNDFKIEFKTASNKSLTVKPDSVNMMKSIMKEDIGENLQPNYIQNEKADNNDVNMQPNEPKFQIGFKTASAKNISIKANIPDSIKNIFQEQSIDINIDGQKKKSRLSLDPVVLMSQKNNYLDSSTFSNNSKLNVSVNIPAKKFGNGKVFKKPQLLDKSKLNKYIDSNDSSQPNCEENMTLDTNQLATAETQNVFIKPSSLQQSKNQLSLFNLTDSSFLKLKDVKIEKSNNIFIVRPIFELTNLDPKLVKIECLVQKSDYSSIESAYVTASLNSLQNLLKRLEQKKSCTLSIGERSKPGYLYELKANKANTRIKLESLKLNIGSTQKFDLGVIKFNIKDFYDLNELVDTGCIKTLDNGCLVSDELCFIGETELYNCFLDSKGVDPKLANLDWFRNHLKWVCWKLYSYEIKFKNLFTQQNILTPMNILSQIKYRYDIEIGQARRSCLKKIIEKDDTSTNKLLILFVSNIFETSSTANMIFIELSDGWYPIRALCDFHLTSLIRNKIINIGDKLALFSCELIGCPKDGCPPLETPEGMHLKLSVNSIRKAKWFAKLGFSNPQKPLSIRIDTIKPNSPVGAIDVVIERIYPITYMETCADGSKVFRNQKQEELYCFQKSKLIDHDSDEKRPASNKLPVKRNVTESLKIRVVDSIKKKNNDKSPATCMITIWQNASTLKEQLFEGQRLVFLNLNTVAQKNSFQDNSGIQLSTSRQTSFIFYKNKKGFTSSRYNCEFEDIYNQKIDSSYNEIDLCGVVIMHSMSSNQNLVYLTNLKEESSIICICFSKQSEFYGFKDVLKYTNTIACLNLKFIRKKENNKYPCLLATENSVFTQKLSQYKFLTNQFNLLTNLLNKPEAIILDNILKNLQYELSSPTACSTNSASCVSKSTLFNKTNNKGLSRSDCLQNDQKSNEQKLQAIAEIADTNLIITKNGIKPPGLAPKPKQFQPPKLIKEDMNKSLFTSASSTVNRSVKRTSLSIEAERKFNLSPTSEENEDDEDAKLMVDQDFEALCKNQSSKRKKT